MSGGRIRLISYSDDFISPRLKLDQFKSPITDDEDKLPKTTYDLLISKMTLSEAYREEDESGGMLLLNTDKNFCEGLVIDVSLQESVNSDRGWEINTRLTPTYPQTSSNSDMSD
ncbi:hypothetical protein BY996DRAFT_6615014 [Phakopsora pachyrhizi]|nr:hypothetical protein BY996DRAFT_6615014 [Phakopsora pachyrhizi]